MKNAVKTWKTICTIAILWPVKAILEKRAATVEVATLISPVPYQGPRTESKLENQENVILQSWWDAFFWGLSWGHFNVGLDGPIRANRFTDSRESPDCRESLNPLFCESRFGGLKIANRRFEADSRESLQRYENRFFFCESIRANRFTRIAPIRVANRWAI